VFNGSIPNYSCKRAAWKRLANIDDVVSDVGSLMEALRHLNGAWVEIYRYNFRGKWRIKVVGIPPHAAA
jgi:hypothetical protein